MTRDGRIAGVIGKKRSSFKRDKDEKIEHEGPLHRHRRARRRGGAFASCGSATAVVLARQPVELRNGRVASRSFDNRRRLLRRARDGAARRRGEAARPATSSRSRRCGEEVGDFAARARRRSRSTRRRDRGRRDLGDRRSGRRAAEMRRRSSRHGRDDRARRAAERAASSTCSSRRPRRRSIEYAVEVVRAARRTPTPTRTTSAAPASRPGSSRSRCGTSTRRRELVSLDDVEDARAAARRVRRRGSARLASAS